MDSYDTEPMVVVLILHVNDSTLSITAYYDFIGHWIYHVFQMDLLQHVTRAR